MPNFISEDAIEQAMVQRLQHLYGYEALDCYTADPADLKDGSVCTDKREVQINQINQALALQPGKPRFYPLSR